MELKGCYSHESDNWKTPKKLYEAFMNEGYIDCFPYMSNENQLLINYTHQKLFINPPYSKMKLVTNWIIDQIQRGNIVYLLIPARTDTDYFHKLLRFKPTIYFLKGRLKFNESITPAPFPSIILKFIANYFGPTWYQLQYYENITLDEFIERKIL